MAGNENPMSEGDAAQADERMAALMRACRLREESVRHPTNSIHQAWHDLKECLHVIQLSATLLKAKAVDADSRTVTDFLSIACTDLQQLLTDMPDLARLEAGREQPGSAPFDLAAVLREVATNLRPLARQKNCELTLLEGAPLQVSGDLGKTQRIAENLVRYALKWLRPRQLDLAWQSDRSDTWSFTLHAIGSPTVEPGTPLPERIGLSVARGFCQVQGGSLEISTAGDSATFAVRLPISCRS